MDTGLWPLLAIRPAGKECGGSGWRGRLPPSPASTTATWDKFLKSEAVLRFPHPASGGGGECYEMPTQWKEKQYKGQKGCPERGSYLQRAAFSSLIPGRRKCQGGKEADPAVKP